MSFKRNVLQILFCVLFISNTVFSQVDTTDFALWSSIGVNYSPFKKLEIGVEQHLRLKEDASVTDEYFTDISLEYKILKDLKIGGGARFIKKMTM